MTKYGGSAKVYGAALLGLREEDCGELHHKDGLSPAWPPLHEIVEPFYRRAERHLCFGKGVPIGGTSHQAGTCRFGHDPSTSMLNFDRRAHEVDTLYVTDARFLPSIGAVAPMLTNIANALRVADHRSARMRV